VPLFDPKDRINEDPDFIEERKSGSERLINSESKSNPDEFRKEKVEGIWPKFKGGYHMLHRIDGKLFAVGVLDYTSEALSSVYLFYDPEYEFLSPGTLCALREIEYCRKISANHDPKFKYYYMGLYFQDCQKSVYKANFKPSQVACPHTYKFVYLTDEVKAKISAEKKPKLAEGDLKQLPDDMMKALIE